MKHLVLGRIRKLPRRWERRTAGILSTLLPSLPYVFTDEWPTDPSDINKKHSSKLKNGASAIIPLASQNFSNTSAASQYTVANKSQLFFRAPYNYDTLAETKNNLEPFLSIALRQGSHAPT